MEQKCFGFCRVNKKRLGWSCHATPQEFGTETSCKIRSIRSRANRGPCRDTCIQIFGSHPACNMATPDELPEFISDFEREHHVAPLMKGLTNFLFLPRAAGSLAVPLLGAAHIIDTPDPETGAAAVAEAAAEAAEVAGMAEAVAVAVVSERGGNTRMGLCLFRSFREDRTELTACRTVRCC